MRSYIVIFCLLLGQSAQAVNESKQTFTFAFTNLKENRQAYSLCQNAIKLHKDYAINFTGQSKSREAVDNALAQMVFSGKISSDQMKDVTPSSRKMHTLYLGKTSGFYASIDNKLFCLYTKKAAQP